MGGPLKHHKFLTTDDELVRSFGATSTDAVVVRGQWMYQSTCFSDQLIRVRIDAEELPENWQKVREVKETLKRRSEQLEIWITAHRIDVI